VKGKKRVAKAIVKGKEKPDQEEEKEKKEKKVEKVEKDFSTQV